MLSRVIGFVAATLVLAALAGHPAAAEEPQKLTIAFAGKGMSFLLQYIAIGGGFYKQEGLEPELVDVSSGTRQAAAVMGGSAEITQVGFAHTMHAVGRGGALVGIATAFDAYPIALVLSNDAIKRLGITDTMSLDEKIKRVKGVRIGITSPGSSTDEFMRTIMLVRGMDPSRDVQLQPIGIGAPMVAAMQAGSTDGFAFMSPFTNIAVTRGIGQIIADPITGDLPEYRDVPYQVITTSRATLAAKRPLLLHVVRALTRAMKFAHEDIEGSRTDRADVLPGHARVRIQHRVRQLHQGGADDAGDLAGAGGEHGEDGEPDREDAALRHLRSGRLRRSVARGREGHSGQVTWQRRFDPIVLWQIAVGILLVVGWEAVGRVSGGAWTSRPSLIAVKLAGVAARQPVPPRRDNADRGGHRPRRRRDTRRARRPAARPLADRGRHPAADRGGVLQRAAGRAGAAVHHVLRPRHAAEDRAGDARRVLPAVLQHLLPAHRRWTRT